MLLPPPQPVALSARGERLHPEVQGITDGSQVIELQALKRPFDTLGMLGVTAVALLFVPHPEAGNRAQRKCLRPLGA